MSSVRRATGSHAGGARRSLRLCALLLLAAVAGVASPLPGGPSAALAAASACPTSNAPNELTLAGGTPQTARLDSVFAAPFQVALANSNGCPLTTALAGSVISFSAPSSGPSGVFAASGSSTISVGTDASGSASAPMFTANDLAGGYTLTASSDYGSVSFSLTNSAAGIAASITAQAPLAQSAAVGTHYTQPLQVQVLDANGNPVEGAAVSFALGSSSGASGGTGSAGASFDGAGAQASETTNSSGIATSPLFSANAVAGTFSATATTAGISEPASFQLDNLAGPPSTVTRIGPQSRTALVGTRYQRPLEVKVLDAAGTPIEGLSVSFSLGSASAGAGGAGGAASAGASFLGGATQATETTNAAGIASSPFFSADDTPGSFSATVAVPGRTNPIAFLLDNLAAKPPRIELVGPAQRAATLGTRYREPLEVKVLAPDGKPVEGTTVTFALGSGGAGSSQAGGAAAAGASFADGSAQATATTSAAGIATSPWFIADTTAGAFNATASVPGVTNPASFALDNLAVGPPRVSPLGGSHGSARVGERYPHTLAVVVRAADGKPQQGVSVTFTLGAGGAGAGGTGATAAGASFLGGSAQAIETTDAQGRAVSPAFSANTVAGAFDATASIPGATHLASFPLHNLAGKPTSISVGAAANEQTTTGTRFPVALAVTVTDIDRNPVAGAVVTFRAPAHGAGGSFLRGKHRSRSVRVRTNSDGIAVAPAFRANKKAGGYIVTATVKGAAAAFALVNQAAGKTA